MRFSGLIRACAVSLALLGVLGLVCLPAEHVHAAEKDGHHVEYVHRHFEAHHPSTSTPGIDHEDEALYISPVASLPPINVAVEADRALTPAPWAVPALVPLGEPVAQCHPSAHDPPGLACTDLRGPPLAV